MKIPVSVTPAELPDLLLSVAVARPVFLWGQPGIGKSSMVEQFAESAGMDCVSLLGTQLAPEDIIGVPQIRNDRPVFCPPENIARDEPYVLFLDELNGSNHDVQKAFYSLVLDRRIGNYTLPDGSVVIAAGNRIHDAAIVRQMSSALINRFVHINLVASPRAWLEWASGENIHPLVFDYISARPDHLVVAPPKTEEPFSTPRSWHALSDVLHSIGELSDEAVSLVAHGCLSPTHAGQFVAFWRTKQNSITIDQLLKGTASWPRDPSRSDELFFLSQALRARLLHDLPATAEEATDAHRQLAHNAKALIATLADISHEFAQLVVTPDDVDTTGRSGQLPGWFLSQVIRDLPRLAS